MAAMPDGRGRRARFFSGRGVGASPSVDAAFFYTAKHLAETECPQDESAYFQFGYQAFGPVLYGFSCWLMGKLEQDEIERVLFFARDGYIMREAFKLLPGHERFESRYAYVSRRSLRVPTLWAVPNEGRLEAAAMTKYISVHDFIESVGLDADAYGDVAQQLGLSLDDVFKSDEFRDDERLLRLVDAVWPDVADNSRAEFDAALAYLRGLGVDGKVAVVDIGWRGSIQLFFEKLVRLGGIDADVTGYYLNLSSGMHHELSMRGYRHDIDNVSEGCDELRGYIGLLETMFLKTEGSTERYLVSEGGGVVPVLADYEYAEAGGFSADMEHVRDVQRGALSFIGDYVAAGEPVRGFSSDVAFKNLDDFANHPSWKAIDMFGSFPFFNDGTVTRLAGSNDALYNLTHLGEMKRDLYGSRWRVAFLKRNLKVPLPYYALFKALMHVAM